MADATLYDGDGNSQAINASDYRNFGWLDSVTYLGTTAERFPATIAALVTHGTNIMQGVATDSITIGTGAKSFTSTPQRGWTEGMWLRVLVSTASPAGSVYMDGPITSYNATTGAVTIDAQVTAGSGTYAAWTLRPTGSVATNSEIFTDIGSVTEVIGSTSSSTNVISASGPLYIVGGLVMGLANLTVTISGSTSGTLLSWNTTSSSATGDGGGGTKYHCVIPVASYGASGETITVNVNASTTGDNAGYHIWHL